MSKGTNSDNDAISQIETELNIYERNEWGKKPNFELVTPLKMEAKKPLNIFSAWKSNE